MSDKARIYDQHDSAFNRVSAFVVLKDGDRVATIAFKFPADGAGRLYAYVHWLGIPMVRGFAGGYGYDKKSAACADAARRIGDPNKPDDEHTWIPSNAEHWAAFRDALAQDGGNHWDDRLRDAGFTVFQAV